VSYNELHKVQHLEQNQDGTNLNDELGFLWEMRLVDAKVQKNFTWKTVLNLNN
jgi:hypothetical protein